MVAGCWFVSTMYETFNLGQLEDVEKLVQKLLPELERHLGVEIKRFAQEKDDTGLYLLQSLGVLGVKTQGFFQIKGFFPTEKAASSFAKSLGVALKHAFPKEIADEMSAKIMVVEKIH